MVCEDAKCDNDITARIGMKKTAFGQILKTLVSPSINIRTMIRVIKTYVRSVLMFGCRAWTISKDIRRRQDVAELWVIRRMLSVWMARRTNEKVLQTVGVKRELHDVADQEGTVRLHWSCTERKRAGRDCLLGMVEGRRERR